MVGALTILISAPIVAAPFVYLAGRKNHEAAKFATLGVSGYTVILSVLQYLIYEPAAPGFQLLESYEWAPAFGLRYVVGLDGISFPLLFISTFLTFLAAAGSWELITFKHAEYYALLLLFEGAIIGVFTSLNLIQFYVFWELVLVPMFFFIGIWGGPNKKYAAMKFLIFTHVGSTLMLLGFIALYVLSFPKTFNFTELLGLKTPFFVEILIAATFFIGFGVKLPIVPLHTWLPDAHVEAPAPISVLLAGLLLKMGGYGFLRFNLSLLPESSRLGAPIFIGVGLFTMFYGALVAMIQQDLKRMIALTSINHMGYILVGGFSMNPSGVTGAVFQMFNHANAIGILFLMSGVIHEHMGTRSVRELGGINAVMPKTTLLLVLGSLGAMAFPGFASFVSEFMVILAGISVNTVYAVAVLVPAITAGYFVWTLRRVLRYDIKPDAFTAHDASSFTLVTLAAFLVPLLIFGLYPGPLLQIVSPTVSRLP